MIKKEMIDMGEVIAIFKANETIEKQEMMVVSYDGIEVEYQRNDLIQLTLAYCCSIHKSQGSEFQTVIMPVVRGYSKMLRRNLLYTGITRAKNFLILCGEPDVLIQGLQKTDDLTRFTSLKVRLSFEDETIDKNIEVKQNKNEKADKQTKENKLIQEINVQECMEVDSQQLSLMKLDSTNINKIHPMIGMDKISPYDFID